MLLVGALLALLVGGVLGLLGAGGGILMMPILLYVVGFGQGQAVAGTLILVGATAALSLVVQIRRGRVDFRTGIPFGLAGMVGAFGGALVSPLVPGRLLIVLFGLLMLATSFSMIRGRRASTPSSASMPLPTTIGIGFGVGFLAGLLGAGGGFLIVPALALFGGLTMERAVGTSLLVIAMQSASGVVGHLLHVTLPWGSLGLLGLAMVLGSLGGLALAKRVSGDALKKQFGFLVLVVGLMVVAKEVVTVFQS